MVSYRVNNPNCKRCKRVPSMWGLESMILIPLGSIYFILCGSCTRRFLRMCGKEKVKDLSNLFTSIDSNYYNSKLKEFLRLK